MRIVFYLDRFKIVRHSSGVDTAYSFDFTTSIQ